MDGIEYKGKVYTPNNTTGLTPAELDERNRLLEKTELANWAEAPEQFGAYITSGDKITTWLGTPLGQIIFSSHYHDGLGYKIRSIRVRGNNGAFYYGKFAEDWGQFVRLRKNKSTKQRNYK